MAKTIKKPSKKAVKKVIKNKYYCRHCGKTLIRPSEKEWIKVFCFDSGLESVRIMKVK